MSTHMTERTIRLLAVTDWWCGMLDAVCQRMSYDLDQESMRQSFESRSEKELLQYFSQEQIDQELLAWPLDPRVRTDLMHANTLFVVGALYQIEGFSKVLSSDGSLWNGDLARLGNAFRGEYKARNLKSLRNILEHADEHMAFEKKDIATDLDSGPGVVIVSKGMGPVHIHLWGNDYRLWETIGAARAVQPSLEYEIPESMMREQPETPDWYP